ncbi:MAG: hypothetical protein AAF934_08135, partial [Bacteroidota bacterium]
CSAPGPTRGQVLELRIVVGRRLRAIGYERAPLVAEADVQPQRTEVSPFHDILPSQASVRNHNNTTNIGIYTYFVSHNILQPPPAYNGTQNSDYQKWLPFGKEYLGKLIAYLEENVVNDPSLQNEIDTVITYLKYHVRWGDWTIPSVAPDGNNVQIADDEALPIFNAYTLTETPNSGNLNTLSLNDNIDAKNRVIRFLNVLYKATKDGNIDSRITTLKVFTAPEFYFRPEGPIAADNGYHAYTYEVYKAIKDVLRKTITSMNLRHWLIVPGTIMWYMPSGSTSNNKTVNKNTYFNSTIVVWQGTYSDNSHKSKLEKSVASHIDGVPFHNWDRGGNAPKVLNKYINDSHLDKHMFTIDGVRTGLEICLEHAEGVSYGRRKYGVIQYLVRGRQNNRRDLLHLQLLVSGGMFRDTSRTALLNNGLFFRNDGLIWQSIIVGASPAEQRYVDVEINTGLNGNINSNSFAPVAIANNRKISLDDSTFKLKPPDRQANEILQPTLSFDQQKIMIFPSQRR